jgi:hypothetical protein
VWSLWRGQEVALELRLLGRADVWLHNQRLALPQQAQEILALLALKPEGYSLDGLLLLLSGDRGSRNALKVALSRLRQTVPISYQPVRLDTRCRADFLEVQELLVRGEVRQALALYRGPLLPNSEAPGIIEARQVLEESLRQAVLATKDATLLLTLADKLEDDLELWEAALEILADTDPRCPLVRARITRIREDWND